MNVRNHITEQARRYANGLRAISSIFCLPAIALALSLLTSAPAASQELVRLNIFGGYGGNNFEYICGPGRVLAGVRGYTGVWIDNVQAVCVKVEESQRNVGQPEGPVFGGNRPLTNSSTCAIGTVATGLELDMNKDKRLLGYIAPRCAVLVAGSFVQKPMPMRGTGLLASEPSGTTGSELFIKPAGQDCPAGTVGVGIRGRAGLFLDALGLVCGPKPEPPKTNTATLGKRKLKNTGTLGKRRLGTPGQSTEVSRPVRQPAGEPVPPPAPVPPFIYATEVVIAAGQTQGTTTLRWDGGNDHPYAEVWVKVGDADEAFIVEQGQGTRQVTIERGKTYLFILTDANQRLATVTVSVKP